MNMATGKKRICANQKYLQIAKKLYSMDNRNKKVPTHLQLYFFAKLYFDIRCESHVNENKKFMLFQWTLPTDE